MASTNINIRMDADLKRQFEAFCADMGMSMTTAFTIFAKKAVREYRIPFEVGGETPNAQTLEAMEEVRGGKLGDVLLVNGSYMQEFHALPSFYSWRYEGEKFLATTEIGSHWIDLMRYITGREIEAVQAVYGSFFPERVIADGMQWRAGEREGKAFRSETDNVAIVTLRLSGGALASMVLSEITQGRYNYLELTVTGSEGTLWWNSEDLNRLKGGKKGEDVREKVYAFGDGFNDSVTNMLSEVYEDIERGGRNPGHRYATFADGVRNAEICNAIYRSAHNNSNWVFLQS